MIMTIDFIDYILKYKFYTPFIMRVMFSDQLLMTMNLKKKEEILLSKKTDSFDSNMETRTRTLQNGNVMLFLWIHSDVVR